MMIQMMIHFKDPKNPFDEPPGCLYRHNKIPQSYFLSRSMCVRSMARTGAGKIQRQDEIKGFKNLSLHPHEKDYIHEIRLRRIHNSKSYKKKLYDEM